MSKRAMVIGLGQFGMTLARSLSERGVDVLAVDRNRRMVESASEFASAVAFDATDEESLAKASPREMDVCVCAIGQDSRESAIIVTALLRQMGVPFILSRANDELTERILLLVGAHEVVNPERAFGERLASRLAISGVVDQIPLGDDLEISELEPTETMIGRTLSELALPKRFDLIVVAVRRDVDGRGKALMPRADMVVDREDLLVVVGEREKVQRVLREA